MLGVPPRRDKDVAALDHPLPIRRARHDTHAPARLAYHFFELGGQHHCDAFRLQDTLEFVGDIRIFTFRQSRATVDDSDPAAKATIGLSELQPDIAAAEHHEMIGRVNRVQAPRCW